MQCDQKWIDKDDQLLVLTIHLKRSGVKSKRGHVDADAALRRQGADFDAEICS